MHYNGPERRRHRVFITQNTEYHMCDRVCVSVRDRNSGLWVKDHAAIGRSLAGTMESLGMGLFAPHGPDEVGVGLQLCFEPNIITSEVRGVRRPSLQTTEHYRLAN